MRSGFACLVGRPNTGKSTLTNALVGQKVAITSSRPQTTRHTIRGVVNREDAQLVLIDTPGLHRPRTLLGERLNESVKATFGEVDVIAMCLPADEAIGAGDQFIARQFADSRVKKVAVVTKTDKVDRKALAEKLLAVAALAAELGFEWSEVVPTSALSNDQVELVGDLLCKYLPEGPRLYPEGELTDEPEAVLIAELIREAALEGVHDELPHSLAVVVEEVVPRTDRPTDRPLTDVRAFLYVERDSQKAIVIGKKGERLKEVGTTARHSIEALLGTPIFLDLRVKVAKDWQSDPKALARLGFNF